MKPGIASSPGLSEGTSDILGVSQSRPDFPVPPGACDCHVHVFGPYDRFPLLESRLYTPAPATVDDLRRLQNALSLQRVVLVQASPQGTDNACVVEALAQLGSAGRGVAVIAPDVTDAELEALDRAGMRGARLNLETFGARDPVAAGKTLKHIAQRIAGLGWHLQVYAGAELLVSLRDVIESLPCDVVADHFGRIRAADGVDSPIFRELCALVRAGSLHVKLSAPHRVSALSDYADVRPFAEALAQANADRLLWGTDWPHSRVPDRRNPDPAHVDPYRPEDDGLNLNRLAQWIPDAAILRKILVDNPASLYRF